MSVRVQASLPYPGAQYILGVRVGRGGVRDQIVVRDLLEALLLVMVAHERFGFYSVLTFLGGFRRISDNTLYKEIIAGNDCFETLGSS